MKIFKTYAKRKIALWQSTYIRILAIYFVIFTNSVLISHIAHAKRMPVHSANGFECTSEETKNDYIVRCLGTFPPSSDIKFESSGLGFTEVKVYYPSQSYFYNSFSGCLCKITYGEKGNPLQKQCKSKKGNIEQFKMPEDAALGLVWCLEN